MKARQIDEDITIIPGATTWIPQAYCAAKVQGRDDTSRENCAKFLAIVGKHAKVLTDHLAVEDMAAWRDMIDKKGSNVFEYDIDKLSMSDVMVADVGEASTGEGIELGLHLGAGTKRLLAVYNETTTPTRMLSQWRHPLVTLTGYKNYEQLSNIVAEYFAAFKKPFTVYPNYNAIDTVDGGGKGALMEAFLKHDKAKKRTAFDVVAYWKHANHIPTWKEVKEMVPRCNTLYIAEPTWAWDGLVVRNEVIRKKSPYGAFATANFFSGQRFVLLERLVQPALDEDARIRTDRWKMTSDVYQPVQAYQEGYSEAHARQYIRSLPGNQRALQTLPKLFIGIRVDPKISMGRVSERHGKQDDAKFETLDFQTQIARTYANNNWAQWYADKGITMVFINQQPDETRKTTLERARAVIGEYSK